MTVTGNPVPGLQYAGGAGRRSRRRPPKRGRVLRRLLVAVVVTAALIGGGIYGAGRLLGSIRPAQSSADYVGDGTGSTFVHIVAGSSARGIGETLVAAGVVKSANAFVGAAAASDSTQSLQPGYYTMRKQMSAAAALAVLLNPASRSKSQIAVPEGITTGDLVTDLSRRTGRPLSQFSAATQPPAVSRLGLPSWSGNNIEGFLFPSTYDLPPGASATTLLKQMVAKFDDEAAELDLVEGAAALHRTPLQVLTVASIIEKEVRNPAERSKVATVIYNRLNDTSGRFRLLGLDSTVRYALNGYAGPLTKAQLAVKSPYNTRVSPGLPPGPIGNPGEAAIQAALHPATGTWLYFVTLPKEQVTIFATTAAEWSAAQARYRAEGGG